MLGKISSGALRAEFFEHASRCRDGLKLFAQEADHLFGLHHTHHAAQRIHDGQRMEVVLIEHFGELVLVQVGGAREYARL